MNLDSFSLYNRMGFAPQVVFQDMYLTVPAEGLPYQTEGDRHIRPATLDDVKAIDRLEQELVGISREKDYRYFVENLEGSGAFGSTPTSKASWTASWPRSTSPASRCLAPVCAHARRLPRCYWPA